ALRPRRALALPERDRLRTLPEREAAELGEALPSLDDGREVVAGERARLRGERAVAVREEQLRLADAAGVEQQLAGSRVAGGVLGADAELADAPRYPVRLAAPAAVDDPVLEREEGAKRRDRRGRVGLLEAGAEGEAGGDDLEHRRPRLAGGEPARERGSLGGRHVGDVAGRHRLRLDGQLGDQAR